MTAVNTNLARWPALAAKRFATRAIGWSARITGTASRAPPVSEAGVLLIGSPAFRQVCALTSEGLCYHVRDYNSAEIAAELQALARRYTLPELRERRPATLAELDTLYGRATAEAASVVLGRGAKRILDVLEDAARLKASDIKLIKRRAHADLRLKLGHTETDHGPQWQLGEATQAIAYLFNGRDYGDGSSAQQEGRHQPFSISAGGGIGLPEGVAALRGQKGFHSDGWDFLVLRLVYTGQDGVAGNIEGLGLDADVLDVLAEERASDNGLMIIGGSTGDGKSTTLVRHLERLYLDRQERVSIVTVEDPVEYPAKGSGIIQMTVRGAGSAEERRDAFSETLRAFVRMNPDIGMVSEIRSADDARLILQFVVSGHKIVTTVHSFSANAVLFRLISLGVDPKEVAEPGVVSLVMRQKLVPVLCPGCARAATKAEHAVIANWACTEEAAPRVRNPAGCAICLKGRTDATARVAWGGLAAKRAVAEYIRVDDRYRGFLETRDPRGAQAYWLAPAGDGGLGGITVQDRIRAMVARGETDYGDVTHQSLTTDAGPNAPGGPGADSGP